MAMGDFDPLMHYGRGYSDDDLPPRWRVLGHNGRCLVHEMQDKRGLPVIRTKAWRKPNEDGITRPYVDPALWAANIDGFKYVRSSPYYAAHIVDHRPSAWYGTAPLGLR